jgi:hypothetical protein
VKVDRQNAFSIALTLFLVAIVMLSGPTSALQIGIQTDKASYGKGEQVTFQIQTDIESGERLPIDNVTLEVTGPGDSFSCTLPFNSGFSDLAMDCGGQQINVSLSLGTGYGYGYGYLNADYDTAYSWGYGYGYGYGTGPTSMLYTVKWTVPSGWDSGSYTAGVTYSAGGDEFSKDTGFTVNPDATTTTVSRGGGEGTVWPTTTTTVYNPTCDFECRSVCQDDLAGPVCYERTARGECTGGTVCCESVEVECPGEAGESTSTTVPAEVPSRNPLTGLVALVGSPAVLFAILLLALTGLGVFLFRFWSPKRFSFLGKA